MKNSNRSDLPHLAEENGGKLRTSVFSSEFIKFPLVFMAIGWIVFGQGLMIYLKSNHIDLHVVVDFVSLIIPSVDSLKIAKVFDNNIARQHHAIMWLFSLVLICTSMLYPIQINENKFFIKKPARSMHLSFALLGLAIISAFLDFYTGIISFGFASNVYGFALLSSFESFFVQFACRYLKLSIIN